MITSEKLEKIEINLISNKSKSTGPVWKIMAYCILALVALIHLEISFQAIYYIVIMNFVDGNYRSVN